MLLVACALLLECGCVLFQAEVMVLTRFKSLEVRRMRKLYGSVLSSQLYGEFGMSVMLYCLEAVTYLLIC